jgi:purine-binding chemotaxis protein CheW
MKNVVAFTIDNQNYALPCEYIVKIVNTVAITPLRHAPDSVLGMINVHGRIVVVVDIRKILELPDKKMSLYDKMIIVKTDKRTVTFIADKVLGLLNIKEKNIVDMNKVISDPGIYEGTIKQTDELILIYNTDKFLSLEEEEKLETAMSGEKI